MNTPNQETPTEKILAEESIKYVVASSLGIITFLALRLGQEVVASYNLANLPYIKNKILVLLSLLLGTLFLLSSYLAFRFYRKTHIKPPSGGYVFKPDPGYYIHKKTKGHYCNPCLSRGFSSRLSIHHKDGLKCRLCGEIYISPTSEEAAFIGYIKEQG